MSLRRSNKRNKTPNHKGRPHETGDPCPSGKTPHRGRKQALGAAKAAEHEALRTSFGRPPKRLAVYKCLTCRQWHLTSQPRRPHPRDP